MSELAVNLQKCIMISLKYNESHFLSFYIHIRLFKEYFWAICSNLLISARVPQFVTYSSFLRRCIKYWKIQKHTLDAFPQKVRGEKFFFFVFFICMGQCSYHNLTDIITLKSTPLNGQGGRLEILK